MAEGNSGGRPDMKYVDHQKLTYVVTLFTYCIIPQLLYYHGELILGSIAIAYIIMTMLDIVFSMNIAGDDECSRARCNYYV